MSRSAKTFKIENFTVSGYKLGRNAGILETVKNIAFLAAIALSLTKPTNENLLTEAHTYVDALVGCAKTSIGMEREALNGELAEIDFDPLWFRSASDVILLHRQKAMHEWVHSTISPRNGEKTGEEFKETIAENFVQSARFDVAEFWAAVGRSNSRALTIMETLEITERKIFIDTAVELVFGGGIAAITLFEREKEIIPICANLRGKTGLSMLKMNDGTDMTETFIPENTDTNVISPTPQGRPEQDVPTTPREEELGATAVVEKAISEDDRAKMRANASGNAENSSQLDTATPNAKKSFDPSTAATLETTPQSQEVEPIEAQKRMGAESGDEQESVLQSGQGTAEPNDEQDDSPQSRQGTAETVEPASPIVVNERSKPAVSVAKKPQRAPKRKKRKGSMTQTVEAARASTQISPKPRKRTRKKK